MEVRTSYYSDKEEHMREEENCNTKEVKRIKPGAQMYQGGNVTISFLSHVFFLVSVVHRPYFHFSPLHEEVDLYLLAFPHSCPVLCFPL